MTLAIQPRRMEQSIFKTIVEMANEMDYADKRQRNTVIIIQRLNEMVIEPQLDTRTNLRSLRPEPTQTHRYYTEPFLARNHLLRIVCIMEYERYRNENNKVREKGFVTLIIQRSYRGNFNNDWLNDHYSRADYHSREAFPQVLDHLKTRFLHWFGLYIGFDRQLRDYLK